MTRAFIFQNKEPPAGVKWVQLPTGFGRWEIMDNDSCAVAIDEFAEWCHRNVRGNYGAYLHIGRTYKDETVIRAWFADDAVAIMYKMKWQ